MAARALLQRSYDSGETWLPENDVVVWNHSLPLAERLEVLHPNDTPEVDREAIDLTSPDAYRTYKGPFFLTEYLAGRLENDSG